MTGTHWLSFVVFIPWIGAALLGLVPSRQSGWHRLLGLAFSLSTLVLGAILWAGFNATSPGYQFEENRAWISSLHVNYHLGLDGMSLLLVLLVGVVGPMGLAASWRNQEQTRLFQQLFLVLQGAALGVFLTLDFFPWFAFWELSLVPAFFLIKLWGGPGAGRAAYQFVIYTMAGSAFMLLGFAALYAKTGTLDLPELTRLARAGELAQHFSSAGLTAVFLGVLLGLAVKVPLFPLHTWLPNAYSEAPTGASMFLTGVMSKMGVYGFIRILWPLFGVQLKAASLPLLWLAVAGVVLGALAALAQKDLKRMVAYSSINHVSLCLLALFAIAAGGAASAEASAAALNGALLQAFNHGLSAAALFWCVGIIEMRSGGHRGLNEFGGIRSLAPVFAGLCGIAMFSSLGLPGLNGFVSEFLVFRGVFGLAPAAAAVSCIGLLATALFLLTFYQRVFHGPVRGFSAGFSDLSWSERGALAPVLVLMLVLGVWPQFAVGLINPLVTAWTVHLP